jgi:hypothetical protein
MKSKAWQKNWIVVMHDDFNNTWTDKTVPCTELQAIRFVIAKHWTHAVSKGTVRIVSLAEWATLNTSLELTS